MFGMNPVWVRVIGLVALTAVIFFAARWVRRRWWRNRFVVAFGFDPGATWVERTFQQPEVDRELRRLAQAFDSLSREENALVNRYLQREGTRPLQDLETYKSIHQKLLLAKKEFWAAHNAAARQNFSAKEKYSDYLV